MAIRIVIPFDPNRTSENRVKSANRFSRSDLHGTAREVARAAWLAAGKPVATGPVRLSIHCRRGRSMDLGNIVGGCKPLIDGVFVDALTPDDGPKWLQRLGGVTQETGACWKGREEVVFTVEEL